MTAEDLDSGIETVTEDKADIKTPKLYRVILLNDDYTTMDFVVSVLETVFKKTPAEAVQIMLSVHRSGQGLAGVYAKQIAEAKIQQVHERAKAQGFPLRCTMEEE
jgi:ATP-dependent Clp protease adaptor protein ClpS